MSYFAEVINGKVVRVIVADQDFINSGKVGNPDNWVETSLDGKIRKQFAGIGYTFDSQKNIFISVKPFPSWVLDSNNDWVSPIPKPENSHKFLWNEEAQKWELRKGNKTVLD